MIELCLVFCFVKSCTHFLRGQNSFYSHRRHCRMRLPLSTAEPAPPPVICSARFLWSRLCSPLSNACTFPLPASLCPDSGAFPTLNHNGCPHLLSNLHLLCLVLYSDFPHFISGSPYSSQEVRVLVIAWQECPLYSLIGSVASPVSLYRSPHCFLSHHSVLCLHGNHDKNNPVSFSIAGFAFLGYKLPQCRDFVLVTTPPPPAHRRQPCVY